MATDLLRREARVALSLRAQPLWFRITKWIVFVGAVRWGHRKRWFWHTLLGAFALSILAHLFYRAKTHGWTRPWGGWDDLEAGKDPNRF